MTVIFKAHFSSSVGNLYEVIASNGRRLLIDCGVTWKKMQKAINYNFDKIAGLCLTHEHRDHSKTLEDVLTAGIDVYSSAGTFKALGVEHRKAHVIRDKEAFEITDTFDVFPFAVFHDAIEPLGFVIREKIGRISEYMLFVTDTSHIKQRFGIAFDIIAICCNYDKDVLQARVDSGDINETFAKRLLTSHIEKEVTKSYIRDCCCLDKCTEIWLLHMSGNNLMGEKVREEIEKEFFVKTIIAGKENKCS